MINISSNNNSNYNSRIITNIYRGKSYLDGTGVKLYRTIGYTVRSLDPFLLFDEFKSDNNNKDDDMIGFGSKAYRGFSRVTIMLDGYMEYKDNKGNTGTLKPGSIQWLTCGKGIIYSETPKKENGIYPHFLQLWLNLPSFMKMCEPHYLDIDQKDIPITHGFDGSKVRVIAGNFKGQIGPIKDMTTTPTFLDVFLPPNTSFSSTIPAGQTVFVYIYHGSGYFGPKDCKKEIFESELGEYSSEEFQTQVDIVSSSQFGLKFLLSGSASINEPMVRQGPFVLNTEEELDQALEDYNKILTYHNLNKFN